MCRPMTVHILFFTATLWVASDGWADLAGQFYKYNSVASVLGVTISDKPLPDLFTHLATYDTIKLHNSQEFLESFGKWICVNKLIGNCTSNFITDCGENTMDKDTIRSIEDVTRKYLESQTNYEAYTTYIAVYAIAQALKNIDECQPGKGLLGEGACPRISSLQRWQLIIYLENVNFTDNNGTSFHFLDNRQTKPSYILLNGYTSGSDKEIQLRIVGSYRAGLLTIDRRMIYWTNATDKGEIPSAICSEDCNPGKRRQYIENEQTCCFHCLECSGNTISNTTNADSCLVCRHDQYANNDRTTCMPKTPDVYFWTSGTALTFCIPSVLGSVATIAVACIFYKHRDTPVVKASSLSHSFVLGFVLLLSFQMVYFYIGIPTKSICKARSIIDGLNLTCMLGIFCAKLYIIVKLFNNKLSYKLFTKQLYRYSWILVIVLTALHLLFNVILELANPTRVVYDYNNSNTILPIYCENTDVGYIVSNLYQLILSLICFIFAFRARNLPKNFQEARFIWFIMFTWCILQIFSIPAHFAAAGKLKSCFQVIFLLLFNFLTLSAFYFSKCYLIYFRPEKNTKEEVGKEIRQQAKGDYACKGDASLDHEI